MFIDEGSYNCVFIFGSLTFIFNYFLNKIEINLLCAIVATNIFFGCKKNKEGFDVSKLLKNIENNGGIKQISEKLSESLEKKEEEEEEEEEDEEEDKKKKIEKMEKKLEATKKIINKKKKKNIKKEGYKKEINIQKQNIEGLLNKFNELKNNKDSVINPQALSIFMNMNKKISNASDESEFHKLKNTLKNNKEAIKSLIDAF